MVMVMTTRPGPRRGMVSLILILSSWWLLVLVLMLMLLGATRGFSSYSHISSSRVRVLTTVPSSQQQQQRQKQQQQQQKRRIKLKQRQGKVSGLSSYYGDNNNNNNNNDKSGGFYDMSKPVLDPLSLRTVRNDALIQYSSLNQSEPLRINLYGLATALCLALAVSDSLRDTLSGLVGVGGLTLDPDGLPWVWVPRGVAAAATLISAGLFGRECQSRSAQLTRIEREMNSEFLQVAYRPMGGGGDGASRILSLGELRSGSSVLRQVLVVAGPEPAVRGVLEECRVLRRRLVTSDTLVVVLPCDVLAYANQPPNNGGGPNPNEQNQPPRLWDVSTTDAMGGRWLAPVHDAPKWIEYVSELLNDGPNLNNGNANANANANAPNSNENDGLVWFGLNDRGRSFGSGVGSSSLRLLQLVGSFLRPSRPLTPSPPFVVSASVPHSPTPTNDRGGAVGLDPSSEPEQALFAAQAAFYEALTKGDREAMAKIVGSSSSSSNTIAEAEEVTSVLNDGGRLDPWTACLEEGARPEGMEVTDPDCTFVTEHNDTVTVAYTTAVEFPALTTESLLAVQRWRLRTGTGTDAMADEPQQPPQWTLDLHRTIPWTVETRAQGMLLCDARGCVALTRSRERRTFGGVLGR